MSRVTTIFVFCESYDEGEVKETLDEITTQHELLPFKKIDPVTCGGNKVAQSSHFWAAFNYFNIETFFSDFTAKIEASKVAFRDSIQVLWKSEDDEIFNIHPRQ